MKRKIGKVKVTSMRSVLWCLAWVLILFAPLNQVHGESQVNTDLAEAVSKGDLEKARTLLVQGANPDLKVTGTPVLILAGINGYTEIVDLLLDKGAQVNAKDDFGNGALFYAAVQGHAGSVETLIRHGANVNETGNLGITTLMAVAKEGHVDIVKMLLAHGADVNVESVAGKTALDWAMKYSKPEVADLLKQAGAKKGKGL